ncbi:uncharacterized protein LOC110250197 [Exaiptasia diaphana]|uniref:Uncharacterized protein n=1 Tax=Exaiptasia diaphana TaxID=2652724 RepID=A0A913Y008_EXADI|nr:uncharacterized protein LOC110250197 [Exaiptasia diaphana]KXJ23621.1 hypothetical protein AC249_AIPGENE20565 [Exaiptasia diaphana]
MNCRRCFAIRIAGSIICFLNFIYCVTLSVIVVVANNDVGAAFAILSGLWNFVCALASLCGSDKGCLLSCSSVMVLLASTFTLVTRYHYYEVMPKYSGLLAEVFSGFILHKAGLVLLVSGIPVMYGCLCQSMMTDKKMVYRVIVDFIDIYEMSELLTMGAKSCTLAGPTHAPFPYINHTRNVFNCTESTFSLLTKESNMEVIIQVLCSFSFLIFFLIYREALGRVSSRVHDNAAFKRYVNITRLIQDIPFFIIRAVVLILYKLENQTIFLVKNFASIGLVSLALAGFKDSTENNGQSSNRRQPSGQTNRGYGNNP